MLKVPPFRKVPGQSPESQIILKEIPKTRNLKWEHLSTTETAAQNFLIVLKLKSPLTEKHEVFGPKAIHIWSV